MKAPGTSALAGTIWRLRAIVKPPVTLGVRGMVLTADRRILLVRHTYMGGLHMPGGAVDPGESAREAMRREVAEESGMRLVEAGRFFHLYWNRGLAGRDHVALFVVETATEAGVAGFSSAEIAEAGFFPTGDLPADVTPSTRRRVEEVLRGAPVADEW